MAKRQEIQKGTQGGAKPRRGLGGLIRALFPPKHEKEKGIAITPEIDARLQELGLGRRGTKGYPYREDRDLQCAARILQLDGFETLKRITDRLRELGLKADDVYWTIAAGALQKYPQDCFEVFGMVDPHCITHNDGFFYASIRKHGLEAMKEVLTRYGKESSPYLDEIITAIAGSGQAVVDEVAAKFGLRNVRTIAPRYAEYGEELTRKIIAECDEKKYYLSQVYPIYRQLEEARKNSVGQPEREYALTFRGTVQDVGFRSTAEDYGKICGLAGSVWNRDNGSVGCTAQGPEPMVDFFIATLRQRFEITKVTKEERELRHPETGFHR